MTAARPNVLLITADQLRADCLSCAGHPLVRTPVLDALAARGQRFARHFGQAIPCGPARASLLTGMYQMNHRAVRNGTPIAEGFATLAGEARRAGYQPWIIGYADSTPDGRGLAPLDPGARGEDGLLGFRQFAPGSEFASRDRDWLRHLRDLGYAHWREPWTKAGDAAFAPLALRPEHSHSAYVADRAIRFFRQERAPWFLHVSFLAPHPPFLAAEPWCSRYRPEDVPPFAALPGREDEAAAHPYLAYRLERLEMNPPLPQGPEHPDRNPAWRKARALYCGLVAELDHHLGRMFAALDALGQGPETLVIFTSDHGEMLGDHWCWGKELPFDAAVRVPLIVAGPGVAPGGTVEALTEHVDLMPTILDLLGAEVPLQCDGHSLRPFLEGKVPPRWRQAVHWEHDFRSVSDPTAERLFGCALDQLCLAVVRTKTEKYVHFAALPPLAYDLARDPSEMCNLAAGPAAAPLVLRLAQRMLDWRLGHARRELTGHLARPEGTLVAARDRRIA